MALNMGLALMEATRYLPVYNASLIVCSAIAGMSFYQVVGSDRSTKLTDGLCGLRNMRG